MGFRVGVGLTFSGGWNGVVGEVVNKVEIEVEAELGNFLYVFYENYIAKLSQAKPQLQLQLAGFS